MKKLAPLVKSLKKYQDTLDQDGEKNKEVEYLHSSIGEMTGFRGYWTNQESERLYYEAVIVRSQFYRGSLDLVKSE